jgi:polysaccharide deacetylase 2 family uncharacterized protein YibQ
MRRDRYTCVPRVVPAAARVAAAAALMLVAGCGSWRSRLATHEPLPDPAAGVAAHLAAANELIEQAVHVTDRHAQFVTTLYHEQRAPHLYKEVRVLYGASLDTFPHVLDQWLRTHGGKVYGTRTLRGEDEGEPAVLVKIKLRVPEKVICWLEVRRRPPSAARLVIIIDDVGLTRRGLDTAAALPAGITFSVLPRVAHTRECAEVLHESGHTIMLHQPMEPIERANGEVLDPGPGAIRVGMDPEAIRATVSANVAAVPHAVAVNNHMGSKATADEATMRATLLELRDCGLPFVDSLTIPDSVCRQVAGELGVPCAVRNAAFLDNSRSRPAIRQRLREACRLARHSGLAITIGHFYPSTLEVIGTFDFGDVEVVPVTDLFDTAAPAIRRAAGSEEEVDP